MAAAIPEMKEPKARARTENQRDEKVKMLYQPSTLEEQHTRAGKE